MSTQIYFIYDSHCPWSYAATELVKEINQQLPQVQVHFLHSGLYDGDNKVTRKTVNTVKDMSKVTFANDYLDTLQQTKDSTLAANVMAWSQAKCPEKSLAILTAMQDAHFQQGNPLLDAIDMENIEEKLKLTIPQKCLRSDKLTKDAEFIMADIEEIQDIIGTNAIPALLLAHNDDLVLLNHNLYLLEPQAIVEAIKQETK
ncbi:DsbA family protein [Colwellia sp. MEBiC06753]